MNRIVPFIVIAAAAAGIAAAGYATRDRWMPQPSNSETPHSAESHGPPTKIILSEQAQENLGLVVKPVRPETTWKTINVPGWIVHRPGLSDRGVVAPATGVVTAIHRVPGDTVKAGDKLFTVKLLSESLHLTQSEFFRNSQEMALADEKLKRLNKLAAVGAESQVGIAEAEAQIRRLQISSRAYRQELLTRGLSQNQIEGISQGTFVSEQIVVCPPLVMAKRPANEPSTEPGETTFEIQELKVELGQQVQAGQTLCLLANHEALAIEGKAFRDEMPLVERSYKENWPVEVDFEETGVAWGPLPQPLTIRYIANTIDSVNRTFPFLIPLDNHSKTLERDGGKQLLWRFRPGQRVRLSLRVEELKNVFVVPADAVMQDSGEAYVFTQNVNTFERRPVRLQSLDRQRAILVNDGTLLPGTHVVQNAAAQLNRILRASSGGGVPKGYHMHADGSLHKNGEDE